MKISLASMSVKDPIAAHKFYTEVLGFQSKMFVPEAMLAIVVSAEDPDGAALLLEPRGNFGSGTYYDGIYDTGMPIIVFGTDDIQRDYEQLKAKGVSFKGEPKKEDYGTQAIFDDTCGNFVQLLQA